MAEGCIASGVKKFLGIGTCAEYEISNDPIPFNGVLKSHTIYSAAKAGLEAITKGLARELAPEIKVNAIAPGAMLEPPDITWTEEQKNKVIDSIPLKRMGSEKDIAEAVKFLAESDYITGQIIKVDGGRSL